MHCIPEWEMPPSDAYDEVRIIFPYAYFILIALGFVLVALLCAFVVGLAGVIDKFRDSSIISSLPPHK